MVGENGKEDWEGGKGRHNSILDIDKLSIQQMAQRQTSVPHFLTRNLQELDVVSPKEHTHILQITNNDSEISS